MLQQVILVEKNKFVYKLLTAIFSAQSIHCYVVAEDEDFAYQIEDLKPQVIIVNVDSLNFDWIKDNLGRAKYLNFTKVAVGKKDQASEELLKYFDQFVNLPINPYDFVSQLNQWI